MSDDIYSIYSYISQARQIYQNSGNISKFLRKALNQTNNTSQIIEVTYDLQSGNYVEFVRQFAEKHQTHCREIATYFDQYLDSQTSLLEVGCGEMTTLSGIYSYIAQKPLQILGFDISLSRIKVGLDYWKSQNIETVNSTFFVADLFNIPLSNNSVDIVFTAHALEPNGGKEVEALRSIFRIARKRVLLFEPYFEMASADGQSRMLGHGYVKNLPEAIKSAGGVITDIKRIMTAYNPLNPTYVFDIFLDKSEPIMDTLWIDPVTSLPMIRKHDHFFCPSSGLAYR